MVVMINSMVIMVMMNRMVMMDMINRTVMMVTPINEVKPGVRLLKPFGPGLCRLTGVAREGGDPDFAFSLLICLLYKLCTHVNKYQ